MDLNSVNNSTTHHPLPEAEKRTPLPIKQLLILVTILIAEPLTNSIIRSFGGPPTPISGDGHGLADDDIPEYSRFYSQLLESSLFFAKAATVYQWGRLSDKLGRRPILLMGPFGLGLSTCILGVTNNPWLQTTARSAQGVFGGNLETTKSVIAEVTDGSNRYRAYAVLPLVQSIGTSLGSSMGALLVTLPERFPNIEQIPWISSHSLFIPCTIASIFCFFSFYVTYHGLRETLPPEFQISWKILWSMKDRVKSAAASAIPTSTSSLLHGVQDLSYGIQSAADSAIARVRQEATQSVMKLLPTDKIQEGLRLKELIGPKLIIALLNYAFISFLDQAQQILLPLVYTSPLQQYGLGLSPEDMAKFTVKWEGYNMPVQLILFPWLLKRYGPKRVYASCLTSIVVFFALFPVLHLAREHLTDTNPLIRGLILVHMTMSSLVYMAYGCSQIFIMDAVPDKSSLGSVNGIGQSVGSSARMIAPPFIAVFHDIAQKDRMLAEYLIYAILAGITLIGITMSSLLPRKPAN